MTTASEGALRRMQNQLLAKIDEGIALLESIQSDVTALGTRMDAAETELADHETRIAALEGL